jgi:hypothetical protein
MGVLVTAPKKVRVPSDLKFGLLYFDFIKGKDLLSDLTLSSSMRYIDQLRNHPVSKDEHALYNIPESSSRLLTGDRKNVMALCGSNKGGRFTTGEFKVIEDACAAVEESYQRLDAAFKGLSSDEKKHKGGEKSEEKPSAKVEKVLADRRDYLEAYGKLVEIVKGKQKALAEAPPGGDFQIDPEAEMKVRVQLRASKTLILT